MFDFLYLCCLWEAFGDPQSQYDFELVELMVLKRLLSGLEPVRYQEQNGDCMKVLRITVDRNTHARWIRTQTVPLLTFA